MNSCILMAEIIQEPELRYTADSQLEITQMLVQFRGLRDNDPPANLKVVGWGKLAVTIQQNYHVGDRVILVGRLSMNTIERPEGFKEKRAEMTVQQIQHMGEASSGNFMETQLPQATPVATPQAPQGNTVPTVAANTPARNRANAAAPPQNFSQPQPAPQPTSYEPSTYPAMVEEEIVEDDIPF